MRNVEKESKGDERQKEHLKRGNERVEQLG